MRSHFGGPRILGPDDLRPLLRNYHSVAKQASLCVDLCFADVKRFRKEQATLGRRLLKMGGRAPTEIVELLMFVARKFSYSAHC